MSIIDAPAKTMSDQVSTADPMRRRADRETTPGRCGNLDYCAIGMRREVVQVPVSRAFVCPECGGALRPPAGGRERARAAVVPALRILILLLSVAIALSAGYGIGRVKPALDHAVDRASQAAGSGLDAARASLSAPPAPQAPATVQSPATAPGAGPHATTKAAAARHRSVRHVAGTQAVGSTSAD